MQTNSKFTNSFTNPTGITLLILLSVGLSAIALSFLNINQINPFLSSFIITGALGYVIVPQLQRIKASQVIQEDGPSTHLKKSGNSHYGRNFLHSHRHHCRFNFYQLFQ